jgi:membrane protein HdeD
VRSKSQTVARTQFQVHRRRDTNSLPREPDILLRKWKHSAQLGSGLILLGITVLVTIRTNALTHAPLLGWLVVASGVVEVVHAVRVRRSRGFLLHLVPGIAGLPIGLLVATQPPDPVAWTLMFASLLIVVGLFRIMAAVRLKFGRWMWAVLDGTASLAFGILLWATSPWASFRYLGIAVGISLILRGCSSLVFALGVRGSRISGTAVAIAQAGEKPQFKPSRAARN